KRYLLRGERGQEHCAPRFLQKRTVLGSQEGVARELENGLHKCRGRHRCAAKVRHRACVQQPERGRYCLERQGSASRGQRRGFARGGNSSIGRLGPQGELSSENRHNVENDGSKRQWRTSNDSKITPRNDTFAERAGLPRARVLSPEGSTFPRRRLPAVSGRVHCDGSGLKVPDENVPLFGCRVRRPLCLGDGLRPRVGLEHRLAGGEVSWWFSGGVQ
ncbi:unnamed protein product, partial [Phaeothamnion confervicola]